MFVLKELEQILQDVSNTSNKQNIRQSRTASLDVEQVLVDFDELSRKVQLQAVDIQKELSCTFDPIDLKPFMSTKKNLLTTDILFMTYMKSIVLERLSQIPGRIYPSARIIICDHQAHVMMKKLQHVTNKIVPHYSGSGNYLLNGPPYNIIATLLLSDLIDAIDRLDKPLIVFNTQSTTGRRLATYDYSIVRQIFPFLKISDLIIIMNDVGNIRLNSFTIDGKREHQVIQFLSHFARSTHLIELGAITKRIGKQHLLYNNVSIFEFQSKSDASNDRTIDSMAPSQNAKKHPSLIQNPNGSHLTPTLLHLSYIAYRLVQLAQQLDWNLESITFRLSDPNGFTKIFSQILDSIIKSEIGATVKSRLSNNNSAGRPLTPCRVLVLDRYFDLQGLLYHTAMYGPFLEQELIRRNIGLDHHIESNDPDELDQELHLEMITNVLTTILRYTLNMKTIRAPRRRKRLWNGSGIISKLKSKSERSHSTLQVCHAINRHLETIKSIYRMLDDGYLLILKLETSVSKIVSDIINTKGSKLVEGSKQRDLIEKIERVVSALKQLIEVASNSITIVDMLRVLMIVTDLLNVAIPLYSKGTHGFRVLQGLKSSLFVGKEFRLLLKNFIMSRSNGDTVGTPSYVKDMAQFMHKLQVFDKISLDRYSSREKLSLQDIVDKFYSLRLDAHSFPTLKLPVTDGLLKKGSSDKIIVLFLGSITFDELAKIKLTELSLTKGNPMSLETSTMKRSNDILTLASALITPDEFVKSL